MSVEEGPSLTTVVKEQTKAVKEQIQILNNVLKEIRGLTQQYKEINQGTQGQSTEKYKYQAAIDYLMQQGKQESFIASTGSTSAEKKCLDPDEAVKILQCIVSSSEKHKCLTKEELFFFEKYIFDLFTKEELLSFFPQKQQRIPINVKLPPPETKT